ncbi:MAG TPA: alpha/beta fold hydrolase [Puia sp.]|nr:alpha/beta fold hydrolase [Puia sp.]
MKYLFITLAFAGLIATTVSAQDIDTLIDVGGYRLHFHILRGTGMPILFEGGAGAETSVWDTILKPIAYVTHATLITYDRAGFGKSGQDTTNHDLDKHGILQGIEGLETALKKLHYDGNLMLVAHSYGGFCATLYAARHPKTVKAAVLIDANLACWFTDNYVDSITKLRRRLYATVKNINWAEYYMGLNLPSTVQLMRKTPFPTTIPAIELVSEINFHDSAWAARWRDCHREFAAAAPNREDITAHKCGHFIFRDNPPLAIGTIVKAYAGAQSKERRNEIMKRYASLWPKSIRDTTASDIPSSPGNKPRP